MGLLFNFRDKWSSPKLEIKLEDSYTWISILKQMLQIEKILVKHDLLFEWMYINHGKNL